MSAPETLERLRRAVADLARAPTPTGAGASLAGDIAVITRRLAEAERLWEAATTGPDPMEPERRRARHDLMNALGAINNYAELIVEDHGLETARSVRAATRALVATARPDL